MFKSNIKAGFALTLLAVAGMVVNAGARPNINAGGQKTQLRTTAGCRPAEGAVDLDINNVRARLMTGGDMWWDNGTSEARYEVPKGQRKNSLFAGSVWIGGFDAQGQLKVAAQTYRQSGNDYWPGPLDNTANIQASECTDWDKHWKITREVINRFRELQDKAAALNSEEYRVIKEWPAKGNINAVGKTLNPIIIPQDKDYAPFADVDGNGIYNPEGGDYPAKDLNTPLPGDQYIWWVFNDKGNVKGESQTEGIGIEVQASAFAFASKDFLNDATFYNYRLINRGNLTLDSTYISTWTDADLGYYKDDFIGCDTSRGLGILYNGKSTDGNGAPAEYGSTVPMVGVDFFKGPIKTYDSAGFTVQRELKMEAFTYYNNTGSATIGNPQNGVQIYNYMTGTTRSGEFFSRDFNGAGTPSQAFGSGPRTKFVFTGDADPSKGEWSECTCGNAYDDRRFVHSSGAFKLLPGVVNDITIGVVWVADVGGCPNTSFKKIRAADDVAQALFNNDFQTIEGPEAPRMVARELDRKIVFYLTNDPISTNYQERFGRDTAAKYRVSAISSKTVEPVDSLYKFEGYRVFQLRGADVNAGQIFNADGTVNNELAIEVFQTDVKNGVSRIINYNKNTDISDTTFVPVVKVAGKDSGVRHSFVITQDAFGKDGDLRLVNYRNYYFVAIAYAYNEFAQFDPKNPSETQDIVYLESGHGAGGIAIPVVAAMPNPANGDMGTVLNADFGDGVIIKRLEGRGNGGNFLQLTTQSEDKALAGPDYQAYEAEYEGGRGPVQVKVIDPVKIGAHDWELFLEGTLPTPPDTTNNSRVSRGLDAATASWRLVNLTDGNVIYSERDLSAVNEQILEKYGLSVAVEQVLRPGDDVENGNGLIESFISFKDPSKAWLAGIQDAEDREPTNWIRSGGKNDPEDSLACNYDDILDPVTGEGIDQFQFYEKLLDNNSLVQSSWAPYALTIDEASGGCAYGVSLPGSRVGLAPLPSVDIVFTPDKSKWTRCPVVETQDNGQFSEGGAGKFGLRKHAGWNMDVDGNGRPVYSTNPDDDGMSWFPGYAINLETGERLAIIFGEDSYLKSENGADMLWNPSSNGVITADNNVTTRPFGGRHFTYITDLKYDGGEYAKAQFVSNSARLNLFRRVVWAGIPLLTPGFSYASMDQGFIPTETRIQFRVTRPYAKYTTPASDRNNGLPLYAFSTKDLAPRKLTDNPNMDKQALLDRIQAVPNPYYGYAGYEVNNLDTRVRIINLPQKAQVNIYSLDGALIQRLEKDNANSSFIDWNVRNSKGLPIASGMYLIHVKADGIGETVIRWFGAMRPLNAVQY